MPYFFYQPLKILPMDVDGKQHLAVTFNREATHPTALFRLHVAAAKHTYTSIMGHSFIYKQLQFNHTILTNAFIIHIKVWEA